MRPGNAGMSRNIAVERANGEDGQPHVKGAVRFDRIVDRRDGSVPYSGKASRIADRNEGRKTEPVAMIPAFADDFRPDPGGIAKGNS